MREFEYSNRKFKLSKIPALKQGHILLKMTPILGDILPALGKVHGISKNIKPKDIADHFDFLAPAIAGFSKLSTDDFDLVLLALCSCVEVQQSHGNWAFVSTYEQIVMQDLEINVLLHCAARSFAFNFASFFPTPPAVSLGG